MSILTYAAGERLTELAKSPFDLISGLTPDRLSEFTAEFCGLKLLYGTQRITKEVMDALFDLASEADVLKKMQKMQSGDVMNFTENRAVLHTAMRDLFGDPKVKKIVDLEKIEHEKLKRFLDETKEFTTMVVIGIGGSNLGPEAIYTALEYKQKPGRRVHFVSNIDPDDGASIFSELDLKKTLVGVISKSGTTLETVSNEAFLRKQFEDAGLDPKSHFVSVTGEGSPLDDPEKYRACFHSWDYVGGRFSSTAIYGGLSLSFGLGYETYLEFLRGAHEMDKSALKKENNLPLLFALLGIWNHNFLGYPTVAIIPYSHALRRFSAHVQQVDMESNGKHVDKNGCRVDHQTGPIIWGEPGTNAQHSFFQLIHQGTAIVPLEVIGFKESQRGVDVEFDGSSNQQKLISNWVAQVIALAQGEKNEDPNKCFEGNRPSSLLFAKRLDPFTMGALFALYEHKVAFQGFIWNINSFDQEGVQLGKVLANKVLESIEGNEAYPIGDAILNQLNEFTK